MFNQAHLFYFANSFFTSFNQLPERKGLFKPSRRGRAGQNHQKSFSSFRGLKTGSTKIGEPYHFLLRSEDGPTLSVVPGVLKLTSKRYQLELHGHSHEYPLLVSARNLQ